MVFTEFNKERWVPLDMPDETTDTQITAPVGRALVAANEDRAGKELPVATGDLARIRKRCLVELDKLELKNTGRRARARGRHLESCIDWMGERSMDAVPENLMAYVRTMDKTSRRRRDAITAARLILRIESGVELAISPAYGYISPSAELEETDDPEQTLAALLRLWDLDQKIA